MIIHRSDRFNPTTDYWRQRGFILHVSQQSDEVSTDEVAPRDRKRETHLTAHCPGLPGWASTRKVKPIWILLKQETASGSGISWAVCKSELRSRQITTPAPHYSVYYRPDALPAAQPTASKHWRQMTSHQVRCNDITPGELWTRREQSHCELRTIFAAKSCCRRTRWGSRWLPPDHLLSPDHSRSTHGWIPHKLHVTDKMITPKSTPLEALSHETEARPSSWDEKRIQMCLVL